MPPAGIFPVNYPRDERLCGRMPMPKEVMRMDTGERNKEKSKMREKKSAGTSER